MPTLVSIVIPCYNAEKYLRQAVESCLAQTHQPLEIIVVDDGSTDGSAEVARTLGVTLIDQPNSGVSVARNKGILAAGGEYIAFLDADDLLLPDCIEARLQLLQSAPDAGLVLGSFAICSETGERGEARKEPGTPPERIGLLEMLSGDWCTSIDGMIVRREAFERCGLFDPLMSKGCEDWEFEVRVAAKMGIVYDPEVRTLYRTVTGSLSRQPLHMYDGMLMLLRKSRILRSGKLAYWRAGMRARVTVTGALIFHRALKEKGAKGLASLLLKRPTLTPVLAAWLGRAAWNKVAGRT